jgi:hypothetical protein
MIHGDFRQTPTDSLPWAEVGDFAGGGYDYGSAGRLYPVGSTVWVMFEMGDDDFPVVIAGRRGGAVTRDDKNPVEYQTTGGIDESTTERPWLPPEGNELPKDVFEDAAEGDRHPTRSVWSKSFKGHTVVVEDRDEHEYLQIIDRAGQTIEMSSPVTLEANENNAAQRGTRTAVKGSQLPQSQLVGGRGYIRLVDVAGQEVLLDGASSNEKVQITSRDRAGTSIQRLTLSSSKGSEKVELVDKEGNTFLMDPNGPTPISLFDYSGNRIEFDAENGALRMKPANKYEEISGGSKTTRIAGTHEQTIVGDDSAKVLGNKFLDVLNDLTASVAGLTSAVLTGPVRLNIVNAQMSGAVDPTAFDLGAAVGGLKIETLSGNCSYGTLAGSMAVKGATVGLGLTPTFKVALGETLQTILNNLVAALQADIRIGNMGAPVPPSPALITALNSISSLIATLLSTTVSVQP